jgi:hypothetical protein
MPKQSSITLAKQELRAYVALNHYLRGDSRAIAADKAGISVATLDKYIATSDIARQVQESAIEAERARLAAVVSAHNVVLNNLLQIVTDPAFLDPEFTLKFLKYLDSVTPGLFDKLGIRSDQDLAKEYSMNGPTTRPEASQMMVQNEFTAPINLKALPDGSVDVRLPTPPGDIIDVSPPSEVSDLPSQQAVEP